MSVAYTLWNPALRFGDAARGDVLKYYGSGALDFGYLGGSDENTGLIYLGSGQYYDPVTGRMLTRGTGSNPYKPGMFDLAGITERRKLLKLPPGWSIRRILSNRRISARDHAPVWEIISLGRPSPACSCSLPGTYLLRGGDEQPPARLCSRSSFLLGLAPDGGCPAAALLRTPVVSYTTISPLPLAGRFVSVARSGRLPRPGRYPASCSMECGRSSTAASRRRDPPTSLG